MDLLVILLALGLLMFVAYRGYSVILFAPICALLAVVLIAPVTFYHFSQVYSWRKWSDLLNHILLYFY